MFFFGWTIPLRLKCCVWIAPLNLTDAMFTDVRNITRFHVSKIKSNTLTHNDSFCPAGIPFSTGQWYQPIVKFETENQRWSVPHIYYSYTGTQHSCQGKYCIESVLASVQGKFSLSHPCQGKYCIESVLASVQGKFSLSHPCQGK